MANLTIRGMPEELLETVRDLSRRDRRSVNREILVLVEDGVAARLASGGGTADRSGVSPAAQMDIWRELSGKWQDDRATAEIVADVRESRTQGREVSLSQR